VIVQGLFSISLLVQDNLSPMIGLQNWKKYASLLNRWKPHFCSKPLPLNVYYITQLSAKLKSANIFVRAG
jgi:hypothetical protein